MVIEVVMSIFICWYVMELKCSSQGWSTKPPSQLVEENIYIFLCVLLFLFILPFACVGMLFPSHVSIPYSET